jgi:predicted peptidase
MTPHSFRIEPSRPLDLNYLLARPAEAESAAATLWPLLVFLHGAGERGADLSRVTKHGPPRLLRGENLSPNEAAVAATLRQTFIVAAPQCPENTCWNPAAIVALIDHLSATQPVDADRIYLTGLSMGGYACWSLLVNHPERFAAVAPICGGGQTIELIIATPPRRAALRTCGVWAFHGALDPVVPLAESERMVALLRHQAAADVQFTIYPDAQHDAWTETYANPALYAWLLRHAREDGGAPHAPQR